MYSHSLLAAALNFFGPVVPSGAQTCAAGWGSAVAVLNNIIKFALSMGIIIAVLMIAYAGFLWVTNPINAENRTKARSVLMNAGIGLLIALGAWLIVNTLLGALSGGTSNIGSFTGFLSVGGGDTCIQANNQTPGPNAGSGVSATGGNAGNGNGTCTVPSGGNCTLSNLQSTFGDNATAAGEICNAESTNNPQKLSGSDTTSDGNSYSVGLFQINLTNSYPMQVDGQNCSAAFSNACQGSHVVQSGPSAGKCDAKVINPRLYYDCVASAQQPENSISAAAKLSNNGSSWSRWSTSGKCGV